MTTPRRALSRVLIYWAALVVLLPLLAVASLAVSSYLASLPLLAEAGESHQAGRLWHLLPLALELITFTLAYRFIPNRSVAFRHALLGGVLATALFEAAKTGFAAYLGRARLPGNLRRGRGDPDLPVVDLRVVGGGAARCLDCRFAGSLPASSRGRCACPAGHELFGLLRLLGRFAQAQLSGHGLHTDELRRLEPMLTDDLLMRMLGDMHAIRVLQQTKPVIGCWCVTSITSAWPNCTKPPDCACRWRTPGCRVATTNSGPPRRSRPERAAPAAARATQAQCRYDTFRTRCLDRRKPMKARPAWLVPFALALASVSAWVQADPATAKAPTLEVKTIDGADWSLAARRERWVVVNFWATWCSPCLKEIPDLSAFDAQREDVEVIGLAYEEIEAADMQVFLKEHPPAIRSRSSMCMPRRRISIRRAACP